MSHYSLQLLHCLPLSIQSGLLSPTYRPSQPSCHRMSSQTPSRGGGGGGGTMTWASSRRLVITNDVPQIVVANGGAPRNHDRNATAFSYASRGTGSPNSRGGFQANRGGMNPNYQLRNMSTARAGGFIQLSAIAGVPKSVVCSRNQLLRMARRL